MPCSTSIAISSGHESLWNHTTHIVVSQSVVCAPGRLSKHYLIHNSVGKILAMKDPVLLRPAIIRAGREVSATKTTSGMPP